MTEWKLVPTSELPDDLRAPLHGLQADREWLVARIRTADDEEAGMLSESIRNRLSQIEEAAYRLNGRAMLAAAPHPFTDEMVERAARAIYLGLYAAQGGKWAAVETKDVWHAIARAALTAALGGKDE